MSSTIICNRYLLFATFLVTGCVSSGSSQYRNEISGLTEMSAEYIEEQWGKPDYILPKTTGKHIKFNSVLYKEQDPVSLAVVEKVCVVSLYLDKEGIVTDWKNENCRFIKGGKTQQADNSQPEDEYKIDERKLPDLPMAPGE